MEMPVLSSPALEVLRELENQIHPALRYRPELLEELRHVRAIRDFKDGRIGISNIGLTELLKQPNDAAPALAAPSKNEAFAENEVKLLHEEMTFLRKIDRQGRFAPTLAYHETMTKKLLKRGVILEVAGKFEVAPAGHSLLKAAEQQPPANKEDESGRLSNASEYPQPAKVEHLIAALEAEPEAVKPLPFDAERIMMAASMREDDTQGHQDNNSSCVDCGGCESMRVLDRLMESSPTIRAAVQQMKALDATMQKIWDLD